MEESFEKLLRRLHSPPIYYPHTNELKYDQLFYASSSRYELLEWLLQLLYKSTLTVHVKYFPDQLVQSQYSMMGNDEREKGLVAKCSHLHLCSTTDGIKVIQGFCTLEENIQFLNHLLDLVETHLSLLDPHSPEYDTIKFGSYLEALHERDVKFSQQIIDNNVALFQTELKLFPNDILSKVNTSVPLPSLNELQKALEDVKVQLQNMGEVVSTKQLESILQDQASFQNRVHQLTEQLNSFEFLMRKFITVFQQEYSPFLSRILVETSQSRTKKIGLGKIASEVFTKFEKFSQVLQDMKHIQQIYKQIQDYDTSHLFSGLLSEEFLTEFQQQIAILVARAREE